MPPISLQDYLRRIHHYLRCGDECLVLGLVFMSRSMAATTWCDLNVHRLMFVAMMLAAKFHGDDFYGNTYYARVGGMDIKEVNELEVAFLKVLDWEAFVGPEEYQLFHDRALRAAK